MLREIIMLFYWPLMVLSSYLFLKVAGKNFKQSTVILREVIQNKGVTPRDPILNYRKSLASLCAQWTITWLFKITCIVFISIVSYMKFSQQ